MKKNSVLALLCLLPLLLPTQQSLSQSETATAEVATQPPATQKTATQQSTATPGEETKSQQKAKSKAGTAAKKQDSAEIFIPSEAISEDLSVSFPVDI